MVGIFVYASVKLLVLRESKQYQTVIQGLEAKI